MIQPLKNRSVGGDNLTEVCTCYSSNLSPPRPSLSLSLSPF